MERTSNTVPPGLEWTHEPRAEWDADKARILGGAPPGVFDLGDRAPGDLLPGDWWHVVENGRILGYGWVDFNWADGEVLLAVAPDAQGRGVGSFILEHLHDEARARGVNHLYNVIPAAHPDPFRLASWLGRHGYRSHGDRELRANVARPRTV